MPEVDIAIVGAGPTGLFAAYYAGFRGLSVAVIDALPEPGGQVTAMYPEKAIYDVGGFPVIKGRDLVANLVEQAGTFNPTYLLGVQAEKLSYHEDGRPMLTLSDSDVLTCGAVLITGGLGSFTARPLPAADSFGGEGILFFVRHLNELAGHDVVIVGGGDSAFDWALALQPLAKSVTLIHRRDKFRAHAATVARVQSLPVEIIVNAEVTEILGDGKVTGCVVAEKAGATAHPAGRHRRGRARLHRRPRSARRVGPDAGQAPHRGRLDHRHQPAAGLRGGRHLGVPGEGPADRDRVRRGGHRGQQRGRGDRPGRAPVPRPLLRQRLTPPRPLSPPVRSSIGAIGVGNVGSTPARRARPALIKTLAPRARS